MSVGSLINQRDAAQAAYTFLDALLEMTPEELQTFNTIEQRLVVMLITKLKGEKYVRD